MGRSKAEDRMARLLAPYAPFEREHMFARPRRWRFDFAWPEKRIAVEVDGVFPGAGGRHQRPMAVIAEAEKYETALLLGWLVYRVPAPWLTWPRYQREASIRAALRIIFGAGGKIAP